MPAMQLKDRIGCRVRLQDIHVLMTVVETGSMGKAAAVLNTGQPAISRSVAELERALGVQLLERNRQGVRATEYGRALLSGGTAVFDDLRQSVKKHRFPGRSCCRRSANIVYSNSRGGLFSSSH